MAERCLPRPLRRPLLQTQQATVRRFEVDVDHRPLRRQAGGAQCPVAGLAALLLPVFDALDDHRVRRLEIARVAAPPGQFHRTLVILDAEPRTVRATVEQMLPPAERALAQLQAATHHVIVAAAPDDRARRDGRRPELAELSGQQRIVVPGAGLAVLLLAHDDQHHAHDDDDHPHHDDEVHCPAFLAIRSPRRSRGRCFAAQNTWPCGPCLSSSLAPVPDRCRPSACSVAPRRMFGAGSPTPVPPQWADSRRAARR